MRILVAGHFDVQIFNDAILPNIDAVEARFIDPTSFGPTFTGTILRNNLHFGGANLCETNFTNAVLRRANMVHASISGANMQRVRLDNAHMAGCRFLNTDLTDAILVKADLKFEQLIEAQTS